MVQCSFLNITMEVGSYTICHKSRNFVQIKHNSLPFMGTALSDSQTENRLCSWYRGKVTDCNR